jgi:hypothetical protein
VNLRQVRGQRSSRPAARRRGLPELVQLVLGESGYSRRRDGEVSRSRGRSVDSDPVGRRRDGEVYPNSCSSSLVSPGTRDGRQQVYLKMVNYPRAASMRFTTAWWRRLRLVRCRSPRTGKPTCSSDFGCIIIGWFSGSCQVFSFLFGSHDHVVLVIA